MVTIRQFTHADAAAVQRGLYPDMTIPRIERMIDDWNSGVYQGRRFEMFAVVSEDGVVGCVSLYEHSARVSSVGAEIFPGERGKGTAAEAVSLLLHHASEEGCRIILDQVRADNAASIRLHEKLGFESDGCVYRNRRGHEVVLYLKPIP